eukprot:CAMPEP_0174875108 /NCGR_PEP_ID=MMETSP1114-20130205/77823_1 /TAXON_ID=312471 /ORGANISM="Neobodo designis, Strain CCAP 1951/1" /LENGTH=41 /DNA_ID= /DNA_START= /DNA_END= /DNA_ORIENTATION=
MSRIIDAAINLESRGFGSRALLQAKEETAASEHSGDERDAL